MTQHPARTLSKFSEVEQPGVGASIAWLVAEAEKLENEAAQKLLLFERNAMKATASAWREAASQLRASI